MEIDLFCCQPYTATEVIFNTSLTIDFSDSTYILSLFTVNSFIEICPKLQMHGFHWTLTLCPFTVQ